MIISCHTQLDCIVEYETDSYFLVSQELLTIVNSLIKLNWVKQIFWALLTAITVHYMIMNKLCEKCVTDHRVTIYEKLIIIEWINAVISCYLKLWKDYEHVINISEEKWMNISLLNNWKNLYKTDQFKIYSLRLKDCEVINEVFNKLHNQDWINWMSHSMPFIYLCFVIWKSILTDHKKCIVVNIQVLNWIIMSDIYSVFS